MAVSAVKICVQTWIGRGIEQVGSLGIKCGLVREMWPMPLQGWRDMALRRGKIPDPAFPIDAARLAAGLLDEARALECAAQMVAQRLAAAPSDGLADIADRASGAVRSVRRHLADALVSTELFDRERGRV